MAKVSAVYRLPTGGSSGPEIPPMNARQPRSSQLPANKGPPGRLTNVTPALIPTTVPAIAIPKDQEYVGLLGRQIVIVEGEGKLQNFPRDDQSTVLTRGHIFRSDDIAGDALVRFERQMC